MNRICLATLALGSVLLMVDTASAQRGRGCTTFRSYSYSTPYYTYRSYGPGTHISRYAPTQSVRHHHHISRSTHYRLPPTVSPRRSVYAHPHVRYGSVRSYGYHPAYGPGYGYGHRSGVSLNIRF